MYKVGVAIPVYHGRDTLPKMLDSLHAQSEQNFLVCLGIDCDGEDYTDIVNDYLHRGGHIICAERKDRGGPGMARQSALSMLLPQCEYIVFGDQDDIFTPPALGALYNKAVETYADIIISTFIEEQPDKKTIHEARHTSATWHHGKIYKSPFLKKYNISFTPQIFYNEDCYFNVVASNLADRVDFFEDFTTYIWQNNPKSVTRNNINEFVEMAWDTFVGSQFLAIEKIIKEKPTKMSPTLAAKIIAQVYIHYERGIINNYDLTRADKWFPILRNNFAFQLILKEELFYYQLALNTPQGLVADGKIVPMPDNSITWAKTMLRKEQK